MYGTGAPDARPGDRAYSLPHARDAKGGMAREDMRSYGPKVCVWRSTLAMAVLRTLGNREIFRRGGYGPKYVRYEYADVAQVIAVAIPGGGNSANPA
jgi:hypothetical protein